MENNWFVRIHIFVCILKVVVVGGGGSYLDQALVKMELYKVKRVMKNIFVKRKVT